ncbi:reticulon-like protein of the endoplasmic reticulum [Linnemannia zychae]|nr:reticulon-like protein of the endoplasmic reticulum [Linnemannia zychae]
MSQQIDPALNYLHDQTVPQKQSFVDHQSTVSDNAADTPARRDRSSSDSPDNKHIADKLAADPYAYMTPRLKSLVLWENPVHSGGVLAGSLAVVLSCRWVSLLNLACAAFVFGISASFIYVNGLLVFNRVTGKSAPRPLEKYYSRSAEFLHLEADRLHRRVDYITDGLNIILTELAKVVLVEDNKRSLKFIGIFYAIWTLRTWFSTTTLLSIILVTVFATPRLYLDNQTLIDAHAAKANNLIQAHVGKGRQVAQEQWTNVYSKAEQFAKDKGLLKKAPLKTE